MTGSAGVLLPSWYRSRRMVQRNLLVYKHTWIVIFTGFFEPVFYLFGIGLGIGALVPSVDGISYVSFVAPGLLAASCLNGALTDGCFNIWFKLHFMKTYDGILATPMRVPDVAFGEMLWAVTRGSIAIGPMLTTGWPLRECSRSTSRWVAPIQRRALAGIANNWPCSRSVRDNSAPALGACE